jgi:DNA-binding transcriptional LysR family regulator
MTPINFNHFYYFYEVARHRGFTAASRVLMISQSALSIQVRSLEEALGTILFDRTKGGVELTESGQTAFQVAERVFHDIDRLVSDLGETKSGLRGAVSVGTVNSIGIYVLPEVLGAFRAAFPEVDVRIDFKEVDGVIELLIAGRVDVAMIPWNHNYPDLIPIPLRPVKMFLVAPPDHALAVQPGVHPRDLGKYPFVGYQKGMHTRTLTDSLFKRMSVDVEYAIESANAATIKHMVMAGMGVAIVPEFAVADELRRGQLARIEVPMMTMTQELTAYIRKSRTLSPTRAQFLEYLQEYFRPPRPRHVRAD